jgi:hypothetical protein
MPLSCRLSPAAATFDRNRSYSSQISLDQGISACRRLHQPKGAHRDPSRHRSAQISPDPGIRAYRLLRGAKELTEILPSTRNATAQPGRSWICHREALLPSARSYRMKGMPRAGLHCRIHRGSIAVRIVMVRRREEGGELSSCSYLSQCDALQRNDRHRDSQEDRIQSGRSRVLVSNWPCRQGFQLWQGREPTVVTLDTTAVPRLVARSCMNNTLLSIWWGCMMGSMLMRSAKRLLPGFVLSSFGPLIPYRIVDDCH